MSEHQASERSHGISPAADRRRLLVALGLIVAFMLVEVVTGLVSHSLALISDAAHMLTDAGALAMSLVVMRLAATPPKGGLTYGLKRTEILSGLINGVTLLVLAAVIVYEAAHRLVTPLQVDARYMLGVALAGLLVNVLIAWQLARAERRSLNVEGSYLHVVNDLYAFIGTAIAASVILATGFARADALASLAVAGLMFRSGYRLIKEAVLVLLEAAPAGMSPSHIVDSIWAHPLVVDVHDFHIWEITSGLPALSAHVLVQPEKDCHQVRRELEKTLFDRFGLEHTTLQVDHARRGSGLIQVQTVDPDPRQPDG